MLKKIKKKKSILIHSLKFYKYSTDCLYSWTWRENMANFCLGELASFHHSLLDWTAEGKIELPKSPVHISLCAVLYILFYCKWPLAVISFPSLLQKAINYLTVIQLDWKTWHFHPMSSQSTTQSGLIMGCLLIHINDI